MDERKETILIVDDEESIRDIVSRRLEEEGYECTTAVDGKEALWKSFMQDFDLVLTDIRMPGLSGLEVLSQISSDHPDTGVVMITAVAETTTAVEAMKSGAFDYVTKPFNMDDLVMRVQRALDRRRLVLENREYRLKLEQKVQRQVGQIREYYQEAIEALAREEMTREELDSLRRSESAGTPTQDAADDDSHDSSSPVKGFAKKLSQLIGAGPTGPLDEASQAVLRRETPAAAGFESDVSDSNEDHETGGLDLYEGTTEIAIVPPVNLRLMLVLHEHLRTFPEVQILNLGGSVDNGITIRLVLHKPTPLVMIVRGLPEVARAVDEAQEPARIVTARKSENPPVRRLVVELKEETTEATNSPELV